MGAINDAIEAINADGGLTEEQKRTQRANAKITGWNAALKSRLPYTINIDGARQVEILNAIIGATPAGSPMITAWGVFRRNGQVQPYSWPWKIINPPLLIASDQADGDVTRTVLDDEGQPTTRWLKEDILEALRQIANLAFR